MKVIKWNPLQVSSYCLFCWPSSKLVWINEGSSPSVGGSRKKAVDASTSARHCGQTVNPPHPEPGVLSRRLSMAHVGLDGQTDLGFSYTTHCCGNRLAPSLPPGPFQKVAYSFSSSCFCYLLAIAMKICLWSFSSWLLGFSFVFVSCSSSKRCPRFPSSLLSFILPEGKGGNYELLTSSNSAGTRHCVDCCNISKEDITKRMRLIF